MRVGSLILKLQEIEASKGDVPVVLIVNCAAYRINEVWWGLDLPYLESQDIYLGAVCIGDDPR